MTVRTEAVATIEDGGVIAVMRGVSDRTVEPIGRALAAGGITAVEVTADTPGMAEKIARLREAIPPDLAVVGAGTVLDAPTARTAQLAGADFIVTPTFDEDVIETANRYGCPVIPGIMTPTEAQRALEAGADAVKLFPAASLGSDHLRAIRGPLPQVPIVPTGGITLANAGQYIEAGAIAVGTGSALLSDELIAAEDWDGLEDRAAAFVEAVGSARP